RRAQGHGLRLGRAQRHRDLPGRRALGGGDDRAAGHPARPPARRNRLILRAGPLLPIPQVMALSSALCTASATILIQRGLRGSSFYAGAWINVVVGAIAAWTAAVWLVPAEEFTWRAVPYFALSGLIGTTGGRLFRILAIEKVGAPVASAVNNMTPLVASGLAILLLGEHVTLPIV